MPGNLMSQYDQEFGGKTGISSNQRINSILSQLGNQSGLVNTARGLANQSGANINELANTLLGQYRSGIEAKQQQMSPLMSIWDRMFAEENANERARLARSGSGSSYSGTDWDKFLAWLEGQGEEEIPGGSTVTDVPGGSQGGRTGSEKALDAASTVHRVFEIFSPTYKEKISPVVDKGQGLYNKYSNIKDIIGGAKSAVGGIKSLRDITRGKN
jgi:hypothetical protein